MRLGNTHMFCVFCVFLLFVVERLGGLGTDVCVLCCWEVVSPMFFFLSFALLEEGWKNWVLMEGEP